MIKFYKILVQKGRIGYTLAVSTYMLIAVLFLVFQSSGKVYAQSDTLRPACLENALTNGALWATSDGNLTTAASVSGWSQTSETRKWHKQNNNASPGVDPLRARIGSPTSQRNSSWIYSTANGAKVTDDSITIHVVARMFNYGIQPRLTLRWVVPGGSTAVAATRIATVTLTSNYNYSYVGDNGARVYGTTSLANSGSHANFAVRVPVGHLPPADRGTGTLYIRAEYVSGPSGDAANSAYAVAQLYSVFIEKDCPPQEVSQPPFLCGAGYAYITQDYNGGGAGTVEGKTGLYRVNLATADIETVKEYLVDTNETDFRQLNALAYNTLDNYIYAHRKGTSQIVRIGSDGSLQYFDVPNLGDRMYAAADIDANGVYHLYNGWGRYGIIDRIDLKNMTRMEPLIVGPGMNRIAIDIAFNPHDGFIYILGSENNVESNTKRLQKIDPVSGAVTTLNTFNITTGSVEFGAFWMDSEGNLWGSQNTTGAIWKFTTEAPYTATLVDPDGPQTSSNDGARCPYAKVATTVNISGNVWKDVDYDALWDNSEHGINPGNLYAILVNQETDTVIDSVPVSVDGHFEFLDVSAVGIYKVILTVGSKSVGSILTASDPLPGVWVHTGTNVAGEPNTSNTTGIIANIVTYGEDVTDLNFGLADAAPVPIVIASFTAHKVHRSAQLNWQTNSERNSKGFEVERSADARKWESIGFVPTIADNSSASAPYAYSFVDEAPHSGKNLYRLKLVDLDGVTSYSDVRTLSFDEQNIVVFPNPATDELKVSGLAGKEKLTLFDIAGGELLSVEATEGNVAISLKTLPAGVYFLHVKSNGSTKVLKVIKH